VSWRPQESNLARCGQGFPAVPAQIREQKMSDSPFKQRLKHLIQWLARRSIIIATLLFFALGALIISFLVSGFVPTSVELSIGIAAISALFSAISAFANLLQAVEVQKQRESQERPYVIAYFDAESNGVIDFVIENSGNSPALNVTVKFNPAPIDFSGRPLNQVSLFEKPISFLPVGKSLRQLVDVGHSFLADGKPTKFSVSLSYTSIHHEIYRESAEHDLAYLKQATRPGKSVEDNLEAISKELEGLARLLKGVCHGDSVLVESPDQYHARLRKALSRGHNDSKTMSGELDGAEHPPADHTERTR
jgi:multidrug efflux pump subunit AcrB